MRLTSHLSLSLSLPLDFIDQGDYSGPPYEAHLPPPLSLPLDFIDQGDHSGPPYEAHLPFLSLSLSLYNTLPLPHTCLASIFGLTRELNELGKKKHVLIPLDFIKQGAHSVPPYVAHLPPNEVKIS